MSGVFRGVGGSSSATTDVYASTISEYANTSVTKASEAASYALSAATSATNAAFSESNTTALYDSFDDRYLGSKANNPTTDNDGSPLVSGTLYFNTTDGALRVYNGTSWAVTAVDSSDFLTQDDTDALYEPLLDSTNRMRFSRTDEQPIAANSQEGDVWYETDTETLYFYREISQNVFSWVPISTGTDNSDMLDGGYY